MCLINPTDMDNVCVLYSIGWMQSMMVVFDGVNGGGMEFCESSKPFTSVD